jgi:hypothetical protein
MKIVESILVVMVVIEVMSTSYLPMLRKVYAKNVIIPRLVKETMTMYV